MRAFAALLLSLAAATAGAQTAVYRCGSSYASEPCAGARAVAVDDARDATQQRAAADVARRERQLADTMRRERLAEEREASKRVALAGIGSGPRSLLAEPRPAPAPAQPRGKGRKGRLGILADDPKVTQVIEQRAPKRRRG